MNSDDVTRILVEVATGKKPAVPDTIEQAVMRIKLRRECDAIKKAGYDVDIPHEIPD